MRLFSYLKLSLRILWRSVIEFIMVDSWTLAAALAFYTALSLAPILIILIHVTSVIGGGFEMRVIHEIRKLVGPQIGDVINIIVANAASRGGGGSILLSSIVALFSGTLAFAHLRHSLNVIWRVPFPKGKEIQSWLMGRLLSLGFMGGISFLILLSLATTSVLGLFVASEGTLGRTLEIIGTIIAYLLIFAMIYKVLPNIHIRWRDVAFGSVVSVALFMGGNWTITRYIREAGMGQSYGAAGSLFIMLVWVFYVSCLVFFGAVLTYVTVHRRSLRLVEPDLPKLPKTEETKES